MVSLILKTATVLAKHERANYAVQHVLKNGSEEHVESVAKAFRGYFVALAKQKFASNVVEVCLRVVKFETKPGYAEAFVQNAKDHPLKDIEGLIEVTLIQTDENKFTWIAEYDDISSVVNAQDKLVAILDTQRHMLIDVTDENGVTDPESGQIVNRESRKVFPGT